MGNTVGYYSMIHAEAERIEGILGDSSAARALNRENLIQDAQNRAATYNNLATGAMNIASNMWAGFTAPQNHSAPVQGYGQQQGNPIVYNSGPYPNSYPGQPMNPQGGSSFGQNVNPYGNQPAYPQQPANPYGQNPYGQNPYGQNPYGLNPNANFFGSGR